jgi:hypothetical protein
MNHIKHIFKLYENLSESDESWIWIVEYKSWLKLLKMPIIFIESAPNDHEARQPFKEVNLVNHHKSFETQWLRKTL